MGLTQAVQTVAEEQATQLAIEQAVQTFPFAHVPTGHLATQEPPPKARYMELLQAVQTVAEEHAVQPVMEAEQGVQILLLDHVPTGHVATHEPPPTERL